jgi:hypothetical protein
VCGDRAYLCVGTENTEVCGDRAYLCVGTELTCVWGQSLLVCGNRATAKALQAVIVDEASLLEGCSSCLDLLPRCPCEFT